MECPRPEYPRPQFVRANWLCLNGEWEFEIDAGDSGLERGLLDRSLNSKIVVPFCPESPLSGVNHLDFMNAVWYRRTVTVPSSWSGSRILLHFQAVDYDATVWIDGEEVGRHRGGFTPFTCDLGEKVKAGETFTLVLRARDDHRTPQPRGKQSPRYASHGCLYTRTTGIWQTVWMEPVPHCALRRPRITPDLANGLFRLEAPLTGARPGYTLHAVLKDSSGIAATTFCRADLDMAPRLDLPVPDDRRRMWSPTDPYLYDLEIEIRDANGAVIDRIESYAGLRSVALDGTRVLINGKPLFQRLVLDQGYYPDGVMTAPTDADLESDIRLAMQAGFNGARLHQKVFEERFLYHADRLGYLIWGEFGDWGCGGYGPSHDHQKPASTYITQWLEALERDYSHPSIVGWCPLNETHQAVGDTITQLDDTTRGLYLATKAMDTTRPALDASGYAHRVPEADIYDSHDYIGEADFEVGIANMRKRHAGTQEGCVFTNSGENAPISIPYRGQPYFVSEFGGFKWSPGSQSSWGYGSTPTTIEDFYHRFESVCQVLLDNPGMFGYCYTQLTDIFPEENGIYTFDRKSKFDMSRIASAQRQTAAIERE